jgi:hypothetical protein
MQQYKLEGGYLLTIRNAGRLVWRWKCADRLEACAAFSMWVERALHGKAYNALYDAVTLYQFQTTYADAGVAGVVNRKSGRRTLRRWRKGATP